MQNPLTTAEETRGNRCFTCDLDVADVAEQLAEAEPCIDAREVDGLVDLDMGAHEGDAALDALGDEAAAAIIEIVETKYALQNFFVYPYGDNTQKSNFKLDL